MTEIKVRLTLGELDGIPESKQWSYINMRLRNAGIPIGNRKHSEPDYGRLKLVEDFDTAIYTWKGVKLNG